MRGFFSPRARGAGFLLPGVPAPFVYPLAHPRGALTLLLSPLLLPFVLLFAECRVVMRRPERYPRVFFDSLCARYAQRCIICSRRGGSCARLAVRYCHVGRVVVCGGVARVGAWGSSGVLLDCERGRVSVSLVFFFEETTMPERGGTKGAHPGSPACY